MKLRMNENSLFAILLRKPWWVAALAAAAVVLVSRLLLPPQWFPYGAFGCMPFLVIAAIVGWRTLQAPSAARVAATSESVRAMGWTEFRGALEEAWRRDGWSVERLDDGAADLAVTRSGRSGLVCGRRWKAARLGVEPLRELQAARERREAQDAAIVATGEVSDQARAFAAAHRIRIVDGTELARMMPPASLGARPGVGRTAG
ncbi:MAG TPA: restriction endonuclease [Burkholderiaceae bacterium]|nr:restriction endonuclease [Burkholderiaceae bacterium]